MIENRKPEAGLPDTLLQAEIGSPESRAAARALLEDGSSRPPSICISFVKRPVRDADGKFVEPRVRPHDSRRARVGDQVFERLDCETLEDFKWRVFLSLPAFGPPVSIVLEPER